jgi:hypothetical protein
VCIIPTWSNAFDISTLYSMLGLWHCCNDLTSLWPVFFHK